MKPSDVDWSDQASRFAYSDWLEVQGRVQEVEFVRNPTPSPIELPLQVEIGFAEIEINPDSYELVPPSHPARRVFSWLRLWHQSEVLPRD